MRHTILAVLDEDDAHKLRIIDARVLSVPYDITSMEMYKEAVLAREDLYVFRAHLLNKYVLQERTRETVESAIGDYGFQFDMDAGIIYIEES